MDEGSYSASFELGDFAKHTSSIPDFCFEDSIKDDISCMSSHFSDKCSVDSSMDEIVRECTGDPSSLDESSSSYVSISSVMISVFNKHFRKITFQYYGVTYINILRKISFSCTTQFHSKVGKDAIHIDRYHFLP